MTMPHQTEPTRPGVGKKKSTIPWLALALVVIVAAAGLFMLVNRGGDTDTAADGSPTEGQQGDAEGDAEGEGSARSDRAAGTIAAGGATVYPLQSGLTVGDYQGVDVVATDVPVQSVVDGAGFWVGTSKDDRIFVVADDLSAIEAGATVSFTGGVEEHGPKFANKIGVARDEGAKRLRELRGHVTAQQVSVSQTS